jgi:hypothetical protein
VRKDSALFYSFRVFGLSNSIPSKFSSRDEFLQPQTIKHMKTNPRWEHKQRDLNQREQLNKVKGTADAQQITMSTGEVNMELSDSGMSSLRDEEENEHQIRREELISKRRRCFLFVSVFPFLLSVLALFTMLAFNSDSGSTAMDSSLNSMRGNMNGKDTDQHIETSYLADTPAVSNNTFANEEVSTTSSTSTNSMSTTSIIDTSKEDVLDMYPSTQAATSTSLPQTFVVSTASASASTVAVKPSTQSDVTATTAPETTKVETTTPQPDPTTPAATTISSQPDPTTPVATTAVAATTTSATQPATCEEVITHEHCIKHSSDCVWFSPLNWQELCFTKPAFPLNECQEVRLSDDCLNSAVGCTWVVEKVAGEKPKGPEKDKNKADEICRFTKQDGKLRGKREKEYYWML